MKKKENKFELGTKIAPAVGLLLFGEQALAQVTDQDDAPVPVSEPSTLALLAIGAAALGAVQVIKNKKKK